MRDNKKLTNKQKEELAFAVMSQVANLIEFPDMLPEELQNVDSREIKKTLRSWMFNLPGNIWDTRLD